MKFTNTRAFAKHLVEAAPHHFAPVYLVLSNDEGERKEAVQSLVSAILGPKPDLTVIDAEGCVADRLLEELQANSLFAVRRVIHLFQVDKLKESALGLLDSYFSRPNPAVFLVLSAPALHRGSSFYKKVEKVGIILDIEEQKPWEKAAALEQYAQETFAREGVSVDRQVCQRLVECAGGDRLLLQQEIEKIICYVGERKQVSIKDVEAISIKPSNENGWQLGDAIFRRDAFNALRLMQKLMEQEGSIIGLARQLRSQFQIKAQVSALLASGCGESEIQQRFPYMRGNILQQNIQAAQHYGFERLRMGLLTIDEAELQAKSTGAAEERLAEQLVLKLTI